MNSFKTLAVTLGLALAPMAAQAQTALPRATPDSSVAARYANVYALSGLSITTQPAEAGQRGNDVATPANSDCGFALVSICGR